MSQEQEQLDSEILSQAEDIIDQAVAHLESDEPDLSQVEFNLHQALELLEEQNGSIAQDARNRAGEVWRSMVEKTRNMERSEQLLHEGTHLFSDLPVGELLTSMLKRNLQIYSVRDALDVPPGRDWPEWFEKPNAHEWLQTLLDMMDELLEEPSWPILQEKIEHYRGILLEEHLPAYLGPLPEEAHQRARQGDFAQALQTTQRVLYLYLDEVVPHIPETIDHQDIEKLKEAIEARQRGEVNLWKAIVKIVGESSSISEALSGIELELPDHPDVAVDDLLITLSDLEEAARIEDTPDEFSDQDITQMNFRDLEQRGKVHLSTIENPAEFLVRADPQVTRKLQSIFRQLVKKTNNAPEHAVQQLVSELEKHSTSLPHDITTLLKPYWQLIWILERGVSKRLDLLGNARKALAKTQRTPQVFLLRAVKFFKTIQNEKALNEFLRMLNTVRLLNQGLVRYPQPGDTYLGQIDMHPLPEGLDIPESEPQLSDDALVKLEEIAYIWLKRSLDDTPLEDFIIGTIDSEDLDNFEHTIQQYLHDVYVLKHDVWPVLELLPWSGNSLPGKIKSDCELFLQSAAALRVVEEQMASKSAVEIVRSWKRIFIDPGLIDLLDEPVIWLLKPHRSGLRQRVQVVQGKIESHLEDEIRQILERQPPSANQIYKVLAVGLPRELALVVRQSIEDQASNLAREARGKGGYEAALALWGAVRQATRPWVGQKVDSTSQDGDAGDLWRDLHSTATWGYRKALIFARRPQAIAGGIGLIIVLVALGIFGSALLGGVFDRDQPAISMAITSTNTPAVSQTPIPTSTQNLRGLTETAAIFAAAGTATQQAADELAATGTAQALITATALEGAVLGQTATAQVLQATEIAQNTTATAAADPAYQATAAALRCLSDPSAYSLEIIEGPELNPDLGSFYIRGDPVFSATASWTVRNTGECDWEQLAVEPYQNARDVNYSFWGESEQIEINSENPLEVGQWVKILLYFPLLSARDIDDAWILVANGVEMQNPPHLSLEVDDWIIVLNPSPTPTPKTGGKPPGEPKPTPKPSEPPPTARPSEPPPTARP